MIKALLFQQENSKIIRLTQIGAGPVSILQVPRPGDFIEIGTGPGIAYEVIYVVYLDGENGVRLIVSQHP